jgi:hypothetical protein
VRGRVVADDTGRPLAGASILVLWAGEPVWLLLLNPLHFEETASRMDGTYAIPAWEAKSLPAPVSSRFPVLVCFVPGYRIETIDAASLGRRRETLEIRLRRALATPEHRAKELSNLATLLTMIETTLEQQPRLVSALDDEWQRLPQEARRQLPALKPWVDATVQELRAGYDQWRLGQ